MIEHGTAAAAAEQLHYVPLNITTYSHELEGQFSVTLLNRERGRLLVTPEGCLLYHHARHLLTLVNETAALFVDGQMHDALRTGALDAILANHLSQRLARHCRESPDAELHVRPEYSLLLERLPIEGEPDLIVTGDPIEYPLLASRLVFRERLLRITPTDLPAPTPEDLVGLELYVFGHIYHYRRQVDRWLVESAIQPRTTLEIESYPSLLACVKAGFGFACVPESFIAYRPSIRRGFHTKPAVGLDSNDIHFVWRK